MPGLGRAERRKGKCEASRALTACGLGRRVAVDWTWVLQQPRELIKERHLSGLCLLCFLRLLLRSPFLRLSFLPSKSSDLLRSRALAWYSSTLDSPNVLEANLARVRQMAEAQGIDGAKVFKAGSALPEGQWSTFYPSL